MYQPIVLKYPMSSFVPYISEMTMNVHYYRHYLGYLKKLNELLKKNHFTYDYPVAEIFSHIEEFPIEEQEAILFNAGGVVNHELYFENLSPNSKNEIPKPLSDAIIASFGSGEAFIEKLLTSGLNLRGSGYPFLVLREDGTLAIMNFANQETPYLIGVKPLMNIDVWEHAYYLDRLNERDVYLKAFLHVVDFTKINEKYQKAISKNS